MAAAMVGAKDVPMLISDNEALAHKDELPAKSPVTRWVGATGPRNIIPFAKQAAIRTIIARIECNDDKGWLLITAMSQSNEALLVKVRRDPCAWL